VDDRTLLHRNDQAGPTHARSSAGVAPSSSTLPSREPASARRWTKSELDARIAAAPPFAYDPPSGGLLLSLAASYHEITGQTIGTRGQRNLLAAGHRMHGPDFVPFLRTVYAAQGSTLNLLGIVRCSPRRDAPDRDELPTSPSETEAGMVRLAIIELGGHDGPPCPIQACLASLIYCDDHHPPFDATSTRRYDRPTPSPADHPVNPRDLLLGTPGAGVGR